MNGRMKRLVSELMSFLLVFSLIPTPALAEVVSEVSGDTGSGIVVSDDMTVTDNGDGTYTISSADESEGEVPEQSAVPEEQAEDQAPEQPVVPEEQVEEVPEAAPQEQVQLTAPAPDQAAPAQ